MSSLLATKMRETTDAFVKGWEAWKLEPIMAVRAPGCTMAQRPASMGVPVRNNEEFASWFANVEGMLSNCKVSHRA